MFLYIRVQYFAAGLTQFPWHDNKKRKRKAKLKTGKYKSERDGIFRLICCNFQMDLTI